MNAVTLNQIEDAPAAWPLVAAYAHAVALDPQDAAVDAAAVWRRIEAWITHRWTPRGVVFVVEGPGDWTPPLTPFAADAAERWTGEAWAATTLPPSPFGGFALPEGMFRIAGTAGDGAALPEDAAEAWRRLHSYMLGNANARRDELAVHRADGEFGGEAPRAYAAKALTLSGAADLLRPYRRIR